MSAGADPTSRDFQPVLSNMVALDASDLHLKVGAAPTMRIDGVLYTLDEPRCSPADIEGLIETLLPVERRKTFAEERECDVAVSVPGLARFRVNLCRQRGTVGISFRRVPTSIATLEDLGLPAVLGDMIQEPRGLILITGATGSGKSTTMASMIDHLNHRETRKIVTVEDPIEYLHRDDRCLIYQREVGEDTHSFHHGLRHVLRQDPDVILIGEIRDKDTLTIALTAANTGHLVITTLHTMDAVQSIQRVLSYYAPHEQDEMRRLLSGNLRAVVSQRLLPRAGGLGRMAAVEILANTPAVRDIIADPGKSPEDLRQAMQDGASLGGMQTFDQALAELARQEVITPEDAIRFGSHPVEHKPSATFTPSATPPPPASAAPEPTIRTWGPAPVGEPLDPRAPRAPEAGRVPSVEVPGWNGPDWMERHVAPRERTGT